MTTSAQRFDSLAANYATSEVHTSSPTVDRLHELLPDPVEAVCDIGSGAGHTGLSFAGKAKRIVAVDPAPKMLAEVRRLAGERGAAGVETVEAFAESVPLDDERSTSWSAAWRRTTSRMCPKPCARWPGITRVGGHVAVIDMEGDEDPDLDELNHDIEVLHDPTHVRSYTARQWQEWFADHGLKVAACENRQREFPAGLTVKRWCELGNSGAKALKQIRALLAATPDEVLEELEIVRDGKNDYRIPVRTLLIVGWKRPALTIGSDGRFPCRAGAPPAALGMELGKGQRLICVCMGGRFWLGELLELRWECGPRGRGRRRGGGHGRRFHQVLPDAVVVEHHPLAGGRGRENGIGGVPLEVHLPERFDPARA